MDISIIVPAYNEEKRMLPFLKELAIFSKKLKNYEIIFVDDGSTDRTLEIIKKFEAKNKNVVIITYDKNKGKADAIRMGVEHAKGKKILFIDSDGSIPPFEISEMLRKLEEYDAVTGDRTLKDSNVTYSIIRKITGLLFNLYVRTLFNLDIKDNLCGFKGFRRTVAKKIFKEMVSKGWIFDVEIFYRIKKYKYSLYRQPIRWINKKDSKIKFFDPIRMAVDLLKLKQRLG